MFKTILVPLDGSKRSERILDHTGELAKQCGAAIHFLEVLEPVPSHAAVIGDPALLQGVAQRKDEIRHYVESLAEKFRNEGFSVTAIVRRGNVVDTILAVAKECNADLIAMSSHAPTGFARVVYGSVAADVLHRSSIPMLLIHAEDD